MVQKKIINMVQKNLKYGAEKGINLAQKEMKYCAEKS